MRGLRFLSSRSLGRAARLTMAMALLGVSATVAQDAARTDAMIKDCSADVGSEPNNNCYAFYASPDIWVRNINDNGMVHQSPVTGQTNYVRVQVTNISANTLGSGTVHAYFAKASTGLDWPSDWITNYIGGVLYGDEIGTATVTNLAPFTSVVVTIPWYTVPNPANFSDPDARHFCLLARLVSNEDPMTFAEGTSVQTNTKNNNNIAWKNVSIMDAVNPRGSIDVKGVEGADGPTEVKFTVPEDQENVLDHCQINVELGPELTALWKEGGEDKEGVDVEEDAEGNVILRITDRNARIGGLNIGTGTRYTMHVEVVYGELNPDLGGRTFRWDITQHKEGDPEPVGGEAYDIVMPTEEGPDAVIKDCLSDVGAEPNTGCGAFYMSPDIWVRNTNDQGLTHQSPVTGQPNYIYVRVRNIGTSVLNSGDVHVYFSKASTGLDWSSDWINNIIGGVLYGDEIGYATVTNLLPGSANEQIVEIEWNNVPNPADFNDPDARHFCLLARFISNEDPMTYTEGTSVNTNTRNNNNIAWKNVSIMDARNPRGTVDVKAGDEHDGETELRFTVPEDEGDDNVLAHCRIKVELGTALYKRWEEAGTPGEGITPTDDGTEAIWINDANAWIGGLQLDAGKRYPIHVEIVYGDFNEEQAGRTFHWTITQHNEGDDEPVGGEGYDIVMPANPDEIGPKRTVTPAESDLSSMMKLSAHPNPTASGTTIAYTLPSAAQVSIAIYDANGRLVREILSQADRAAGAHQAVWNGLSADGKRLPSGTYLCRLSTTFGSAEQQIKMTR